LSILGSNTLPLAAFAPFYDEAKKSEMLLVKLVYILFNLVTVGLAVWKLGKFGLLPITEADWIASYQVKEVRTNASFTACPTDPIVRSGRRIFLWWCTFVNKSEN